MLRLAYLSLPGFAYLHVCGFRGAFSGRSNLRVLLSSCLQGDQLEAAIVQVACLSACTSLSLCRSISLSLSYLLCSPSLSDCLADTRLVIKTRLQLQQTVTSIPYSLTPCLHTHSLLCKLKCCSSATDNGVSTATATQAVAA